MTEQVYRSDAYARDCAAQVLAINDRGGIVLDRTVFYAAAGGQPGDRGSIELEGGGLLSHHHDRLGRRQTTIVHVPVGWGPAPGGRSDRPRRT